MSYREQDWPAGHPLSQSPAPTPAAATAWDARIFEALQVGTLDQRADSHPPTAKTKAVRAQLTILTEEGLYVRPNDSRYLEFYRDVSAWAAGKTPTRAFVITHDDFAAFTLESMVAAVSAVRDQVIAAEGASS